MTKRTTPTTKTQNFRDFTSTIETPFLISNSLTHKFYDDYFSNRVYLQDKIFVVLSQHNLLREQNPCDSGLDAKQRLSLLGVFVPIHASMDCHKGTRIPQSESLFYFILNRKTTSWEQNQKQI